MAMPNNLDIIKMVMATMCKANPNNGAVKGSLLWVLKFRFPKLIINTKKICMYIFYLFLLIIILTCNPSQILQWKRMLTPKQVRL